MIDDLPSEPVYASTLHELTGVELALPVIVGEDGEIIAFGCVQADRAVLLGYSPWNGWQFVDEIEREAGRDAAAAWNQLCGGAFDDPIPECMRHFDDVEAAESFVRKSLDEG